MTKLRQGYLTLGHVDKADALSCALVAYLFDQNRNALAGQEDAVPPGEGWIWVPGDVLA